MAAPLCWGPDLKAVKTADFGLEMDSLASPRLFIQYSIELVELFDSQDESNY
jgi:hypothetical protein